MSSAIVHQFLIVLTGTDPLVWRRIQVPEQYSFWDLHVAIQDVMEWLDYHLHEFTVIDRAGRRVLEFGIPDDDFDSLPPTTPGWQAPLADYFADGSPPALYLYDFGDDWRHVLAYEVFHDVELGVAYPRFTGGANACPPEDIGGTLGFQGKWMAWSSFVDRRPLSSRSRTCATSAPSS